MKFNISILTIALLIFCNSFSQEKKSIKITKTSTPPKIDAVLNDAVWQNVEEIKDFIQFRPTMGVTEKEHQKTIVKMTYDDKAVYFAAYLYDKPEDIVKQFTSRDNFGDTDFFGVVINPNNDGKNDTEFFVFPSGTQADAVVSPGSNEDFGWNAVWESAVKIVDDGWIVELKIPYSALRFSNQEIQTWGIQFHRHFRTDRSQYTWTPIDVSKGYIGSYSGEITGIQNITPPVRLSFYPFTSGRLTTFDGETTSDFSAGLDVKYGLSENFTLDATLIPDFSQAAFDNLSLNLGPFEQTFGEQRQFFKEGVDLFSKGNLFFSRRVGSGPTGKIELNNDEEILDYPSEVKVLNAIKVSGRTKGGLGVGVFNAITEKTDVTVKDTITGETRNITAEGFANYNIIVLDQQFNENSSVSFINTNVMREGHFRDANVTGILADITNKRNTYNVRGQIKMSNVNRPEESTETGYSSFFRIGKSHGNLRYSINHRFADNKYNVNDLGLNRRNNYNNFGADISYRTFEPTEKLNRYYLGMQVNYRRLANPNVYTGGNLRVNYNAQTKALHGFGGNLNYQFGKQFDYFEPRTEGRFFIYENRLNANVWISTNYNKFFAIDANIGGSKFFESSRNSTDFWFGLSPRFKFNDKFLMTYEIEVDKTNNGRGYVENLNDDIIFGQRDRTSMTNSVSGSYSFNSYHVLTLTFRNNWDTVTYEDDLYHLQDNGRLTQDLGYTKVDLENEPDINFSTWNLDFSYSWEFAPGSFLTALYRNQLFNQDTASKDTYFESLNTLLDQPIRHTFSLRLQYYIDYNNIKNVFKKNNS
jgi:hypothetical protein